MFAMVLAGCAADTPETAKQYFERDAYPVLSRSCAGNTAGCHAVSATDPYFQAPQPAFVGLDPDGAYAVLTEEGYTGAFTAQAPLLNPRQHPGGQLEPTAIAIVEQWFALERQDRGY